MIVKYFDTICLWSDLLGFGKPFYQSNWDLTSEKSKKNIERIINLEKVLKTVPIPLVEKVLLLNDGVIRSVDVYKRGTYVDIYSMWLENAILQFHKLNMADQKANNPGMRGILTFGQRVQYTDELVNMGTWVESNNEETLKEIIIYSPNEFQMNTAFSKAYIIENDGSKAGVKGPNLYIDKIFLEMFINLINESPIQEMTKVKDDYVDGMPINEHTTQTMLLKYTAKLVKFDDRIEFIIAIKVPRNADLEYRKVIFDKDTVSYENKDCNIYTELYKVSGLWSGERGQLI